MTSRQYISDASTAAGNGRPVNPYLVSHQVAFQFSQAAYNLTQNTAARRARFYNILPPADHLEMIRLVNAIKNKSPNFFIPTKPSFMFDKLSKLFHRDTPPTAHPNFAPVIKSATNHKRPITNILQLGEIFARHSSIIFSNTEITKLKMESLQLKKFNETAIADSGMVAETFLIIECPSLGCLFQPGPSFK